MCGVFRLAVLFALCTILWTTHGHTSTDTTSLASKRFEEWFIQNGGVLKGVRVGSYEGMGRGLEAKEAIVADQLVLSAPSAMIMCLSNMKGSTNPDIKAIYDAFPSETGLNLWILYERLNPASRFKEYMDVLPEHVSSLITFARHELEHLQQKDLIEEAIELQESIRAEFDSVQEHLRSGKSPQLPGHLKAITFDQYVWAATILNSRGLRFRGQVHLVPMADLFNYEPHREKRSANSGEFFLKHHVLDKTTGSISIYADRSQSRGLQLFEDYGDNTNEVYIKYHGFVPARNPFHCVTVGGEKAVRQVASLLPSRKPLLDALHFKAIHPSCVDERLALGKHLEVYLTAQAMTTDETNACMKVVHKNKKDWGKVFQQCGFATAAQYMQDKLAGKQVQSMELSSAIEGVDEDEYEDINAQDSRDKAELTVLGERTWTLLQQVFLANVKDATATTLHEDVEELAALHSSPDETHREVAIKYRLANKRMYLQLCVKFQVSCDFLIRRDATNGATSVKAFPAPSTPPATSHSSNRSLELRVMDFNEWFQAHHPLPGLLRAAAMPIYRIGTIATEAIAKGQLYLGVPPVLIMDAEKALQGSSGVAALLVTLQAQYRTRDDFHELLFHLLYEALVAREQSFFWPYLQLLPGPQDQDVPILWSEADLRQRLSVSTLHQAALEYQASVKRKFEFVKNISAVRDFFGDALTFESYRWGTAILDSRSIWWNGKRHLVPMLDFINCKEGRDPAVVHSTVLDDQNRHAVTRAGDDFAANEQVYENYGQPNHIYFLYHGFTLASNTHDCVQVRFSVFPEEVKALEAQGLHKFLTHLGLTSESTGYTACLRLPISPQVWAFLAFKTNTHLEALQHRRLGTPSDTTMAYLANDVTSRILEYDVAITGVKHAGALAFLQSELALLKKVKIDLQDKLLHVEQHENHDEL